MSDEIADFLRRAAQRRTPRKPPAEPIVEADVVEDAEILQTDPVSGDDVTQSVSQHLDASRFVRRASQMATRIERSDDDIEAHMQSVFEHQLGDLGTRTSQTQESVLDDDQKSKTKPGELPQQTAGDTLLGMLRQPRQLRNAVILSEILTRPEHRW